MCISIELSLNFTKYSIFFLLFTLDKRKTTALPCSPSLLLRELTSSTSVKMDSRKLARSAARLNFSSLINVIEEQRRGEQNVRRKPEVAYPTVPPPTLAFHKPPTPFLKKAKKNKEKPKKHKGWRSPARRCFLIGSRG